MYGTYVAMRTLHPILYIRAIQPWRAVVFSVALCIQVRILVCVCVCFFVCLC